MFSKALRVFGLLTVGLVLASCPGLGKINFEIDQTGPMLSEEQDDLIPGASQYSIRFDEAIKLSGTADTLTASLKYPTPNTEEPQVFQEDISESSIGEDSTRLVITIPDDASLQENMEITFTIPAGYLTDEVDNLNKEIIHPVTVSLGAAGIGSFEFRKDKNNALSEDVVATITADKTITAIVPYGTNRNALVATFTASKDATVKVGGVVQNSGIDSNNFSSEVSYTVTAKDGTSFNTYTVKVTEDTPPSPPTDVTVNQVDATGTSVTVSWTVPSVAGTNNGNADTISGYTVYWQRSNNLQNGVIDTTAATSIDSPTPSVEITSLTPDVDYTFAVVAKNSFSESALSAPARFISTKITGFVFPHSENASLLSDITATINGNTITAVVPWGTSSNLFGQPLGLLNTQSTNGITYLDENGDPITHHNYSNDVTLRLKSINGNFHYYTVSVLEIGYKEDEVTDAEAKRFLTPGDLSHPWLFSIKNLDDPEATADIELTLGYNTYSETLQAQKLTVPTTLSDGVTKIYGVSLVNQTIISNAYEKLQRLTQKTATVKITITEAGKKYPVWEESLLTGVEKVYSWHDLQSMDADIQNREYFLACNINFPKPGTYGFPTYGFMPIGTSTEPFSGQLTGNDVENYVIKDVENYVIKDFYINAGEMPNIAGEMPNIGMFDTIIMDSSAKTYIKALTFENPKIIATNKHYSNVGVLAGKIDGNTATDGTPDPAKQFIKGVYVTTTGPNHVIINADATNIGGIVGKITAPSLALFYVSSSGTITASDYTNVGGLVGYSEGIVVVGYSTADVTGGNDVTGDNYVGGLVGYDKGNTVGFSFGTVSGTTSTTIGGLVGKFHNISGYIFGYYEGASTNLSIAGSSDAIDINVGRTDKFFSESIGNHKGLGNFNDALWMFGNKANPIGFNFYQEAPKTFRDNQEALLSSK